MKTMTLRNLPPDLAAKIEQEAAQANASLNATVIRLLRQSVGGGAVEKGIKKHDLDFLIGSWTQEEADEFDRYLEESRRIDMEMTRLEWEKEDAGK